MPTNLPNAPNVFWLTEPCPTWCEFRDTHANRDDYDDRVHDSATYRVATTTMCVDRYTVDGRVCVDPEPPYVAVDLAQHYRETEPRVWVGRDESNQGAFLTLTEAEQLADVLVDLVKVARSGGAD